ncbi:hypothetical protein JXA34_01720 [Patescibacteria group bacterium]|nr:hypothetical protein [Patescibacteria group bacterium]
MSDRLLTKEELIQLSKKSERDAAKALSFLAKKQVEVKTASAELVEDFSSERFLRDIGEDSIVAYTELLTGLDGMSLLTLTREDALDIVDLFNGRYPGTTTTLKEIDRSTIRESINIISNSYATTLACSLKKTILLSVPRIITKSILVDIFKKQAWDSSNSVAFFKTVLRIAEVDYQVHIYFFFLNKQEN